MGHFLLFLVYLPVSGAWGNEGRGKECRGGSAKLLKFRINLSPGNSAHLLSFPSTKCCGTAEYKVSNYFTSSCWEKKKTTNWMQGKVNTQVNQKMESLLPRHVPSFHVKRCWKYYPCIIVWVLKLQTWERGAAPALMPARHYCWIARCASNNTNCWVLRLVLCTHLALSLFS